MFKKIFILFIFFLTNNIIHAQQLDESFLKSLPENLREDFLEQSDNMDDEENIPSPETRINNLEEALEDAERILNNIKRDLDEEDSSVNNELKRVGDKFFQTFQSTFLPINQPNADSTYILDVGDQLTLQLIGQKSPTLNLKIKRNGAINIPDIGDIFLAGMSLQEASERIKQNVEQTFIGVKVFISLTELRDINVLIVGNVLKPGMYTLSGGSSPLSLLYAAGGIDINGSFREITHKRNNIALQNIDLYEVLLKGNFSFPHQLRSGDVLIVNPKLNEIRVSGGVSIPGIYELIQGETLSDILDYSGYRPSSSLSAIQIQRFSDNRFESIEVDSTNYENFLLQDSDAIKISVIRPEFNKAKTVKITGEVKVPGTYTVQDNARLSDIIKLAGAYTENAYPLGGVFTRRSVRAKENDLKEKGYDELVRFLIANQNNTSSDSLITLLALLKDFEPSGRIITEFELSKLESDIHRDRLLLDGDEIHIPSFVNEVFVFGEVINPTGTNYQSSKSVKDYIRSAGGISRSADKSRIILISPNGEAINIEEFNLFGKFSNAQNLQVLPGSVIYIPRHVGKVDGINLAGALAPIISSFAISVASLNSINN